MSSRNALRSLLAKRITLLTYFTLAMIVLLGVCIRLLPMQWGIYLDEFDPYIQYKGAQYVVNNGFDAWYSWFDPTRWAPWGTAQGREGLIGVPFTGAAIYLLLSGLGAQLSLLEVAAFYPVFAGAIMMILSFFLGKELVNRGVGLLAAFVFAVDPTAVQRTALGFFDTESVGMLGLFLSMIFFVKSLKGRTIPYAVISGIALAYMALAWKAFYYPLNLFAIFVVVMILLGRWSKQLTVSFTIVTSITLFALAISPSYGAGSVISPYTIAPVATFIVCLTRTITDTIADPQRRQRVSLMIIAGIIVVFGALTVAGVFGTLGGKLLALINPFSRVGENIVGTVGEQFPSIWSNFFNNYHVLLLLLPVGAYYAIRRLRNEDIFVILMAVAALYGAGSYIRLMIVAAPAVAILGGYGLSAVMRNISLKRVLPEKRSRAKLLPRSYSVLILIVLIASMVPLAYSNLKYANRPAMIVSASTGYAAEIPDWLNALEWINNGSNVPADATVGSWWDYGYWINVVGNRSVIDDNSTTNSTQISLVAEAFLSNETRALEIFRSLGVDYVVVYEPFSLVSTDPPLALPPWSVLGDFEKSTAMMVWANRSVSDYIASIRLTIGSSVINYPLPAGPNASNTTLYQLLFYPYINGYNQVLGITINPPEHFQLVYTSPPNGWVLIYKVNYPSAA